MSARLLLHLAALIAPPLAAMLFCLLLPHAGAAFPWQQVALFGGVGVVAAQVSALLLWRALERRAREGRGAWVVGLGMAALTHLLFGVLFDLALVLAVGGWRDAAGNGQVSDLFLQIVFFAAISMLSVGVITFPATVAFAHIVAARRRKELDRAA